jgi:hypothetical protein
LIVNLLQLRFVLAVTALLAICLFAAGVLIWGKDLTQTQVVLLTLLAGALIAEAKTSSAWTFDGVAPKEDSPPPQASAPPTVPPTT